MQTNKLVSILALVVMAAAPLVVAGEQQAKTPAQETAVDKVVKPDYSFLNGKIGAITFINMSEEDFKNIINKRFGSKIEKFIYNDSLTENLAMLKSGRVDFVLTPNISADYITQRNPDLKSVIFPIENNLVMMLRNSDVKLRDLFDSAIGKLKASGKLDEVYKKWVAELPAGEEPAVPTIEKTSYPETIYVGVSGDLPPLDYVSPDGKPAGYNIALLAEISRIIGKNIKILSLDSRARLTALQAKKIDVFFWTVRPNSKLQENFSKKMPDSRQFSKKVIITKPYCAIKSAVLLKK